MDDVWLKNFRCFRERQTARLAPLTLLVGENSAGKTSFMAMIRALWDVACVRTVPDFKESPYDLGSFNDIVHYRGRTASRAETIEAGFVVRRRRKGGAGVASYRFEVAFGRRGTFPVPVQWRLARGDVWVEERLERDSSRLIRVRTANGEWKLTQPAKDGFGVGSRVGSMLGSVMLYPLIPESYGPGGVPPDGEVFVDYRRGWQATRQPRRWIRVRGLSADRPEGRSRVHLCAPDRGGPTTPRARYGILKARTFPCIFLRRSSKRRNRGRP